MALGAKGIPHTIIGHGNSQRLFTSPLHEGLARAELAAILAESSPKTFEAPYIYRSAHWVVLVLVFLILWHGLRMGWWQLPMEHLPDPAYWLEHGKVEGYRIFAHGEWWRLATALTLHADSQHMCSNILLGGPFLYLLARRLGFGLTLTLAILGGVMGNAINAFYQPPSHSSIGFSTTLFAIIGVLSTDIAVRDRGQGFKRRILLPVAAGLALLALLGTGSGRTDYLAHIFGFLAGLSLGAVTALIIMKAGRPPLLLQIVLGLAAVCFIFGCWQLAFNQ